MKERLSLFFYALFVCLLLPCVLSFFITGVSACVLDGEIDMEKCLPAMLHAQMPDEYGKECKKAQAVLIRTNVSKQLEEGKELPEILKEYLGNEKLGKYIRIADQKYQACREAVYATKGKLLTLQGEPVYAPYHAMSAGKTRNGAEAMQDDSFSYLTAVDSPEDRKADAYGTAIHIPREQLPADLEIIKRDGSGYVMEIRADGQILSGELFRQQMGLSSACFSMKEMNGSMRFYCKGWGHGLGLSQYGAAKQEKAGMSYQEILNYYFPALTLETSADGIS